MTEPQITEDLIASHGLKPDEYQRILEIIGREPTFTELGIFSAMWNEHCSYKSSKKWLRTLPTTGPQVICGPGENAGVVDIGDGQAVVFKMESHNHPSYIEPHQGAATGVGASTLGAWFISLVVAAATRRDRATAVPRCSREVALTMCVSEVNRPDGAKPG